MQKLFSLLLFIAASCLTLSCEDNNGTADPCSIDFDQESLFTRLADELIIPAYQQLKTATNDLELAIDAFAEAPDLERLQAVQARFKTAYLAWQTAAPFEFGPAEAILLRSTVNNFPANINQIQQNIEQEDWDLDASDTYDKGLPTLDYLLFGTGTEAEQILIYFQDTPAALQYVQEISSQIADKVETVLQDWTTGAYREAFITNTGTAAGTSLSLVINNLNQHFEDLRRDKIGIPSGILTLGFTNPEKVEAFYSGLSLELAKTGLKASQDFFTSRNGLSIEDYVFEIGAKKREQLLGEVISAQYQLAISALEQIVAPLSEEVDQNPDEVLAAYQALSLQVINLKTDLPSVLCVAITYVDNPSDSD
jgi:hypothetical protein